MRLDTKLKVDRRKKTVDLLHLLYSRRDRRLDGAKLSLEHRRSQEGGIADTKPLTYGEVEVRDFLSILDLVKPRKGEVFVDLGSGTGKAVLAAACGFPEFSKCRGIELVSSLAAAADDHLRMARTLLAKSDAAAARKEIHTVARGESPAATVHTRGGRGGKRGGVLKKGSGGAKMAHAGLRAPELETLIVENLQRRRGFGDEADEPGNGNGNSVWATAEEIASWLVHDLGHRRYKASLRGYGGLQKFLVARRKTRGDSGPLVISEDGSSVVAVAPPVMPPPTAEQVGGGDDRAGREDFCELPLMPSIAEATVGVASLSADLVSAAPDPKTPEVCAGSDADGQKEAPSSTSTSKLTPELVDSCGGSDPDTVCEGTHGAALSPAERLPDFCPLTGDSLRDGVEFIRGDMFREPWDDAGVVYVASLLFDDSMMERLSEAVERLRAGARVVSLRPIPPRRGFPDDGCGGRSATGLCAGFSPVSLRLLHEGVFRMSWQMARVYIYVRS